MNDTSSLMFVGVTRLSMILSKTIGSFRATKGKTIEEAKAAVWTPERLDKRLWFFKTFCLPSYEMNAALSPHSHGLMMVNEDFPMLAQIQDLCSGIRNLSVIPLHHSEDYADITRDYIKGKVAPGQRIFNYRLDDDDALPRDYLDRITDHARETPDRGCISFNKGFSLTRLSEHGFGLHVRNYPLNAFGLGVMSSSSAPHLIFKMGHHRKIKSHVTHDTKAIGWLSPVHDGNDSRIGTFEGTAQSLEAVADQIKDLFPHVVTDQLVHLPIRRPADG